MRSPGDGRLQNRGFNVYCKFRSEFLKLRRWSLGLRHWMRGRTRQGEPGDEEFSDLMIWRSDDLLSAFVKSLTR